VQINDITLQQVLPILGIDYISGHRMHIANWHKHRHVHVHVAAKWSCFCMGEWKRSCYKYHWSTDYLHVKSILISYIYYQDRNLELNHLSALLRSVQIHVRFDTCFLHCCGITWILWW